MVRKILPGLLLCVAIGVAAVALELIEVLATGRAWVDALVIAILIGTAVRSLWAPAERWQPGIEFSGKFLLEVAVVLLGASLSTQAIAAAGPALLGGIALVVGFSLVATYAMGRLAGLPRKMALLVASGNSICGNSAIAAVAPVIGAKPSDVASAIAFTAVLGVGVVLLLPFAAAPLRLDAGGYGVVAGLTVYAVPQVLAATAPIGSLAVQVGTMVKLVRVLMLGPLVLLLSLAAGRASQGRLPPMFRLVPWFVIGFVAMAIARSLGLIPEVLLEPTAVASAALMIVAMAALGLGVDVRSLAAAGPRVSAVVTASLLLLAVMALALVRLIGMGA